MRRERILLEIVKVHVILYKYYMDCLVVTKKHQEEFFMDKKV